MERSIADLLAAHPVFAGLALEDLALIAGCGRNTAFPPGYYLFREGARADQFFVVREGRVAVEIFVPDRGGLVVDTVDPGEVVGASWLFPPYAWEVDARCVEAVRAVALDGACLRTKCDGDPRLGYELMKRFARVLHERIQSAQLRLLDLYGTPGGR
ncbi:MAG TPA: cyclic nucleotide-binding domain-containing protein [Actinomycetota bacterium]|nr:cyclic nucleotide-binding domain-containing protein [Actinomycetota bacterium]